MKVAIASGKGGTGKTTVAVNLAIAAAPVRVLDCDVEDPDSAIFLQPRELDTEVVEVEIPQVDTGKCESCRACAKFCAFNAIVVLPGQWILSKEMCKGCGGCYLVCPQEALSPVRRRIGQLETGETDEGVEIVSGRLDPGEAMPTPLIDRVRQTTNGQLEGNGTIIDGPPGSACSMIAAIKGADFCLMVTEPTPFGLHDLQLAVSVARTMSISVGVIINRSDLGDSGLREYCARNNVPILLEIPYDETIARQYARGIPIVRQDQRWREKFKELWSTIQEALRKNDLGPRTEVRG